MVHISKKRMTPEVDGVVGDYLLTAITKARTKRDAYALVSELLGPEERIAVAKRLAAIAMLMRNYGRTQIQELLKVSPDTIERIWRDMRKGRYAHVIRYVKHNPKKIEGPTFLDMLEQLLRAGIMPPMGRGRYAQLDNMLRESDYYD